MSVNKLYIQRRYAELLRYRLNQCEVKSQHPFQANFRCGLCGDSAKNKHKKRGFLLENDKGIRVFCHNCGYNESLSKYLEDHQPDMYQQYSFDLIIENKQPITESVEVEQPPEQEDYLSVIKSVVDLPETHKARKYLAERLIPETQLHRIYYCGKFYAYINHWIPKKFSDYQEQHREHPRIILPLTRQDRTVFGVVGRSLIGDDEMRYITIKFDPTHKKIFGLDALDLRKHALVVEGGFDSLFLPNALALAGTDGSVDGVFTDKKQFTIVLDNEPRNKEVHLRYSKYISKGCSIVVWPETLKFKDINEMILGGLTQAEIMSIIASHTFSGLQATIKFNKWKKI